MCQVFLMLRFTFVESRSLVLIFLKVGFGMNTPKEVNKREKILDSARILFAKNGYFGTSMREIADQAGVNKALLFYYFGSKKKLYHEVLKDMVAKFRAFIKRGKEEFKEEGVLSSTIKSYIKLFSAHREVAKIFLREVVGIGPGLPFSLAEALYELKRPMVEALEEEMDKGNLRGIDPQFVARAVIGMIHIFFKAPIPSEYDDEAIHKGVMDMLKDGIIKTRE